MRCGRTPSARSTPSVYVGDCCEENRDHLVTLAEELGRLKVPVFVFQEGRDQEATDAFKAIAGASGRRLTIASIREAPSNWESC